MLYSTFYPPGSISIYRPLMHMTSQKGAPACWGSNEAVSHAPSPSMQPVGQPLHAIPPGRPGPAHRLRANTLPAQHVRAARQVLTPNMASLLCIRSINAVCSWIKDGSNIYRPTCMDLTYAKSGHSLALLKVNSAFQLYIYCTNML